MRDWQKGKKAESKPALWVKKEKIAENGDYNLTGDRYRKAVDYSKVKWPMVRLGEVARIINGRAYKREELLDEGPIPVLRVGNFFSNREWYYSDLELPKDKYCQKGDLLYAWSASFGPKIWDGPKAIYHYHIWKIETKDQIDRRFLFYLLDWDTENIKSEGGRGIAMVHITKSGMEKREIPLPPLEVQQKIARELDSFQKVIDGARQVAENWKPHIKINPDWPMVRLGEVIETITPPIKIKKGNYSKKGIFPIIDQSQVEIAGWTDDSDALIRGIKPFVIFGDHTCAVKYIDKPFAQGADGIKILTTSYKLLPRFLYFILKTNPIESDGYKRHFTKLKQIQIPFPPLEIQKQIITEIEKEQKMVEECKKLITIHEQKIKDEIAEVWGEKV